MFSLCGGIISSEVQLFDADDSGMMCVVRRLHSKCVCVSNQDPYSLFFSISKSQLFLHYIFKKGREKVGWLPSAAEAEADICRITKKGIILVSVKIHL